MTNYQSILYKTSENIAEITLNRPKSINAFHTPLRTELLDALKKAQLDSNIRVIILTGAGRGFSAGTDLNEDYLEKYNTITELLIEEYKPIIMAIDNMPKIIIAAVNGAAAGIGGAMAMACDLIVMGKSAFIYQAFAPIGLIPDGGSNWQLVNSIGYKRAFELIVTGGRLAADKCLEYGLINKIVEDDNLLEETRTWATELAKGSPLSQEHAKKLLKSAQKCDLEQSFCQEAEIQETCITSEDYKEGVNAFFEKRAANFKGK